MPTAPAEVTFLARQSLLLAPQIATGVDKVAWIDNPFAFRFNEVVGQSHNIRDEGGLGGSLAAIITKGNGIGIFGLHAVTKL